MDLSRWISFSKSEQLLMIGTEFERAKVWQDSDQDKFKSALERALGLVDLTLEDPKWKENLRMLLVLRGEISKFYIGERRDSVEVLYQIL